MCSAWSFVLAIRIVFLAKAENNRDFEVFEIAQSMGLQEYCGATPSRLKLLIRFRGHAKIKR